MKNNNSIVKSVSKHAKLQESRVLHEQNCCKLDTIEESFCIEIRSNSSLQASSKRLNANFI